MIFFILIKLNYVLMRKNSYLQEINLLRSSNNKLKRKSLLHFLIVTDNIEE